MKKILASLLVLALCAPAMAATVSFVDNADGTGTFTITADGAVNIVGLGLDVDATAGGGNITAATVDTATFNIYPDAAHDLEVAVPGSYTYGAGTPIANQGSVGEAAISNSFAISVGALNGETTPGATGSASVAITVTVDADTEVCIAENALRGGLVLTDGTGEDLAGTLCGAITMGSVTCYDVLSAAEQTDYDAYVAAGADPSCWCWQYQCHGDVDNATETFFKYVVYGNDIAQVVANWKLKIDSANPCADIDHASETFFKYRVYGNDIATLVGNWKKKAADLTDCPTYLP